MAVEATAHTAADHPSPTAVGAPEVTADAGAAFMDELFTRARAELKTIVLPEAEDERILTAASRIAAERLCRLVLLGEPDAVRRRAADLGAPVDHELITILDPTGQSDLHTTLTDAQQRILAERDAARGASRPSQPGPVDDAATAASLLVRLGMADGFVSGAAHTTADTLRPALKLIGPAAGQSLVSSVFFMLLPSRVLVFGDCAVIPAPSAEQLAEIAHQSAHTARAFGIDPKVALLSYSTGDSGSGDAVDTTRAALAALRAAHPDIASEGPIQFDAAVNPDIARKKLPDSSVAGHATVLVFPNLEAGNIAYKAVQQTSGAAAVGPILQGMAAPVNDLSRGCTVDDIIATVAATAVQAQAIASA